MGEALAFAVHALPGGIGSEFAGVDRGDDAVALDVGHHLPGHPSQGQGIGDHFDNHPHRHPRDLGRRHGLGLGARFGLGRLVGLGCVGIDVEGGCDDVHVGIDIHTVVGDVLVTGCLRLRFTWFGFFGCRWSVGRGGAAR